MENQERTFTSAIIVSLLWLWYEVYKVGLPRAWWCSLGWSKWHWVDRCACCCLLECRITIVYRVVQKVAHFWCL